MSVIDTGISANRWKNNIQYSESSMGHFNVSVGSFRKIVIYEDEPNLTYHYVVMNMNSKEVFSLAYRGGSTVSNVKYPIQ